MLDILILTSVVFFASIATFLFLTKKDSEDQEDNIDVYICDVCSSEECLCEKESGGTVTTDKG